MISALLMMFLLICLSIVSFLTVVCPSLTVGLAAPAEFSTSLLSTAYFVLLFTTIFYSGQRMFLLIAFGVAVHFKQHSSLTYQNSSFFRTTDGRQPELRNYGQGEAGSRLTVRSSKLFYTFSTNFCLSSLVCEASATATCSLIVSFSAKRQRSRQKMLRLCVINLF